MELLIGSVLTVLASGGLATIVVKLLERRKLHADVGLTNAQRTDVLVTAGEKAVSILEGQLDRAMKRLEAVELALGERDEKIRALEAHISSRDTKITQLEQKVRDLRKHVDRLESGS